MSESIVYALGIITGVLIMKLYDNYQKYRFTKALLKILDECRDADDDLIVKPKRKKENEK